MSRRLRLRGLVLVLGLALAAAGLVLVDWQQGRVLDLPPRWDLDSLVDASRRSWWPWAQGAAGVVLALAGLFGAASHLPGRGPRTVGAAEPEPTGTVDLDLASLGSVLTHQLGSSGTTTGARASFHRARGRVLCVVDARLSPDADLDNVVIASRDAAADLARAVPSEAVELQLRWSAPRRGRPARSNRRRVRLE